MNADKIKIRRANPDDLENIIQLITLLAEFDRSLAYLRINKEELREALFTEQPKTNALLAEYDGKTVGIATYYFTYSTFITKPGIWLDDLYILENYRNLGVGKALIEELRLIAKQNNCGRIDWMVARDNSHGIEFYEKLGAKIFEEVRHARFEQSVIDQ
jgi:GNAT superfamily N-acetyltransferase